MCECAWIHKWQGKKKTILAKERKTKKNNNKQTAFTLCFFQKWQWNQGILHLCNQSYVGFCKNKKPLQSVKRAAKLKEGANQGLLCQSELRFVCLHCQMTHSEKVWTPAENWCCCIWTLGIKFQHFLVRVHPISDKTNSRQFDFSAKSSNYGLKMHSVWLHCHTHKPCVVWTNWFGFLCRIWVVWRTSYQIAFHQFLGQKESDCLRKLLNVDIHWIAWRLLSSSIQCSFQCLFFQVKQQKTWVGFSWAFGECEKNWLAGENCFAFLTLLRPKQPHPTASGHKRTATECSARLCKSFMAHIQTRIFPYRANWSLLNQICAEMPESRWRTNVIAEFQNSLVSLRSFTKSFQIFSIRLSHCDTPLFRSLKVPTASQQLAVSWRRADPSCCHEKNEFKCAE